MTRHRLELTPDEQHRVDQLLDICHANQGDCLPVHHWPGSWTTTYTHEFIVAATELYQVLSKARKVPPFPDLEGTRHFLSAMFDLMAEEFARRGIRSCRRTRMSREAVRHLWESHIHHLLDFGGGNVEPGRGKA